MSNIQFYLNDNVNTKMLKQIINDGEIDIKRFLDISIKICNLIKELHKNNIVYGSINAYNILINENTKRATIVNSSLKNESIEYMSPEQMGRVNHKLDYRTDFYSVGVVFYEMITGKLPFQYKGINDLIHSCIAKSPIEPYKFNYCVPKVISDIIMKLMSKNPSERYKSAYGLKSDLEKCRKQLYEKNFISSFPLGLQDISSKFKISSKLYGRNEELNRLIDIFSEVSVDKSQLVFISGESGIGKSSLIREFKKSILNTDAICTYGKFDKHNIAIPYIPFIQAFKSLIDKILSLDESKIKKWKSKLLKALGNNAQIMINIIPDIEIIIGKQAPVEILSVKEEKSRFNDIITKFIQVFVEECKPFILFIDDLQWTDSTSLKVIEHIIKNIRENLLVITSYKNNQNSNRYEIFSTLENIKNNCIKINKINLLPLSEYNICKLIMDSFNTSEDESMELANLAFSKTKGNPFLTKQFFYFLYQNKFIKFDYNRLKWNWDINEIRKSIITSSIAKFIKENIKGFSQQVKYVLEVASCLGDKFNVDTLSLVCNKNKNTIENILEHILDKGILLDEGKGNYTFLHDNIKNIILESMTNEKKEKIHFSIGNSLFKSIDHKSLSKEIFNIVSHLNLSINIIKDDYKKNKLIKLNIVCAQRAKNSIAYLEASNFLNSAIKLLNKNSWRDKYNLTKFLYMELAECEYLSGNLEKSEETINNILKNVVTDMDKANVYNMRIVHYINSLKIQDGIELCKKILKMFSISFIDEKNLLKKHVNEQLLSTWIEIKNKDIKGITHNSILINRKYRVILSILKNFWVLSYICGDNYLSRDIVLKMINISLKYGNNKESVFAYIAFASIIGTKFNDYNLGYDLGLSALELNNKFKGKSLNSKINYLFGAFVNSWKQNLKTDIPYLKKAYNYGIESGDLIYLPYIAFEIPYHRFIAGENLDIILFESSNYLSSLKKNFINFYEFQLIFNETIECLKYSDRYNIIINKYISEGFNIIDKWSSIKQVPLVANYKVMALNILYIFGYYKEALKYSQLDNKTNSAMLGKIIITEHCFYYVLTIMALYKDFSEREKEIYIEIIEENLRRIKVWVKNSPENFLHKYLLIKAEKARILNEDLKAMELYDKAIEESISRGFINIAAIANELAGKYYLSKGRKNVARSYILDSIYIWNNIGAFSKVEQLKSKYCEVLSKINKLAKVIENKNIKNMDLNSIIKISQVISDEMDFDKLLKKLIDILVENAGAQRAYIITEKHNKLWISIGTNEDLDILKNVLLKNYNNIAKSVVYYVKRTGKDVILNNVLEDSTFFSDLYIRESKPQSILCIPITYQGELKGIVYLENNLTINAFTSEKVEILKILASQASISIENSLMYNKVKQLNEDLENKVESRTKELEKIVKILEKEISERRKIEIDLKQSEERYRYLMNVLPDAVYVNCKGINIFSNRSGAELLEFKHANDLVGRSIKNFIVGDCYKVKNNIKNNLLNNKININTLEQKLITKSGKIKFVEVSSTFFPYGNKEATLNVVRDITERKRAEELSKKVEEKTELLNKVMEYDKLKTEFFANISHELKTPLNVIFSALQMLELLFQNMPNCDEKFNCNKYMKMMKQNCYRLIRLITNLIDITKIDAGYLKPNFKNQNIVQIVEDITMSVVSYVEVKGINIIFDTNVEEKIISCDVDKIERIVLNLLSNAVKFTNKGGNIFVNIECKDNKVLISVKDTGIGIPKEKQTIIFERFIQVDKSLSRNQEGSGIGLSLVKSFVEMHGGKINITSELNKGTEFIVEIPNKALPEDIVENEELFYNKDSKIEKINIEFSDIYFK
ncbi:sensor histidine kinase TodS [Clostridium acetireducens DSM 10703]|uniref:histidine kinase n=1 Tax=Clostridium acetireducens DSM 10703 TaxID=1121290 RepID=A0A1E8F1J2_9CLOT|nr:AAA family ATPase [Clostridium acetireducens]OFI07019.1 sensor histidine kinase TodS [Clostridium acetireducens DSM 10703]